MKKIIMICGGILIALCCVIFFVFKSADGNRKDGEAINSEKNVIINLITTDVQEISYWNNKQKICMVAEDGIWYEGKQVTNNEKVEGLVLNFDDTGTYVADKTSTLSQEMVKDMLATLENVVAIKEITDTSLRKEYGFDNPVNRISLKTGSKDISFNIGKYDEESKQCYIMLEDDYTIYVVDGTIYSAFAKGITELTKNQ